MMYHRLVSMLGVFTLALWGQTAGAASIALNPPSTTIEAEATFDLEFFLDARETETDFNGPHPGNFCGVVRIDYDPNLLMFRAVEGALEMLDNSREILANGREAISFRFDDFAFDTQPDAGVVGIFTFEALGGLGSTDIGIQDGEPLGSFFNHAAGTNANEFFVPPSTATVQVVPLPAAAWLFLGALGGLGLFGRKSRAANRIA